MFTVYLIVGQPLKYGVCDFPYALVLILVEVGFKQKILDNFIIFLYLTDYYTSLITGILWWIIWKKLGHS